MVMMQTPIKAGVLIGICVLVCVLGAPVEAKSTGNSWCNLNETDSFKCGFAGIFNWDRKICRVLGDLNIWTESKSDPTEYSLRCAQAAPCSKSFTITASKTHSFSLNLEGFDFKLLHQKLSPLTAKFGYSFATSSSKTDSGTCNVEPGYEGTVHVGYELVHLQGLLEHKTISQSVLSPNEAYDCNKSPFNFTMPATSSQGTLLGSFDCKTKPIANVTNEWARFDGSKKLTEGHQYEAIGESIGKLIVNPPAMNDQSLQSYRKGDHQAWTLARCWNHPDYESYKPICSACIKYLASRVWAENNRATEGEIKVKDCFLRYALHPIDRDAPIMRPSQ